MTQSQQSGGDRCECARFCVFADFHAVGIIRLPAKAATPEFSRLSVPTDVGDVTVHQQGTGSPIIFLHPRLFSATAYEDVFRKLPSGFAIHAIDWWGHGASGAIDTAIILEEMTGCLRQVVEKILAPNQPAAIVGTSMGGMIALRFAINHPGLVSGLVIIGSSADEEETPSKRIFESLARQAGSLGGEAVLKDVLALMFSANFRDVQSGRVAELARPLKNRSVTDFMPCINAVLNRRSIRQGVTRISAKTIVVVGDEDIAEPPPHSEILSELLPHAELIVVPNCGHLYRSKDPTWLPPPC